MTTEKENLANAAKCLESAITLLGQVQVTGWDQVNNLVVVGKFLQELHNKTATALSLTESSNVETSAPQN